MLSTYNADAPVWDVCEPTAISMHLKAPAMITLHPRLLKCYGADNHAENAPEICMQV
jgi:hypothetical protein